MCRSFQERVVACPHACQHLRVQQQIDQRPGEGREEIRLRAHLNDHEIARHLDVTFGPVEIAERGFDLIEIVTRIGDPTRAATAESWQ